VLTLSGVVDHNTFIKGFSQDILLTVAMLSVIAKTLEVNGILKYIAQSFLTRSRNRSWQLLSIILPTYFLSLFINNVSVVLMLMPLVREWAKNQMRSPSKFLIPLSYASMLGGMCTLMGSTTNLVVDSLMRTVDPTFGFGFFELGMIAFPCGLVALVVLFFLSERLLPSYPDPLTSLSQQTREFSAEFLVEEHCPFVGQSILYLANHYFNGASIVEIERNGVLIDNPKREEVFEVGDRLVFVGDVSQIAPLHYISHLKSLSDPHFQVNEKSLHFSEIVISETSSLIGRTLRQACFRSSYGATVLAVYRQGKRVVGRIGDVLMQPGDTLMLLSSGKKKGFQYHSDFYIITDNEEVKSTAPTHVPFILSVLSLVILCAGFGLRPMLFVSTLAGLIFLVSRVISPIEAIKSVYWNLLVLIASAFTVAEALRATQVVDRLADFVHLVAGNNPYLMIGFIFLSVVLLAEAITSNAAALLMYPVALKAALLSGFDLASAAKAVGMTVAVAASSAFQTPIGYQTNLIVYGPGGYRFRDYAKLGLPLCLLVGSVAVYLIPRIWL
jgi:di/tricarboxylate transporter